MDKKKKIRVIDDRKLPTIEKIPLLEKKPPEAKREKKGTKK